MQTLQPWFKEIIGKTVEEASEIAAQYDWRVRPNIIDGELQMVTLDINRKRANVTVENGLVKIINKIG